MALPGTFRPLGLVCPVVLTVGLRNRIRYGTMACGGGWSRIVYLF
jgi:hypothetical protein